MGNLKLKGKGIKGGNTSDEKVDEAPAPVKTDEPAPTSGTTTGQKENEDLPKKRKLAEYLLSQDLNVFKKHLPEVRNLSDEKFYELFEGNTEYNYNVKDEKGFRQLAQKFEDNKDLIYECYDKEENYYKYALQIWKPNIIQGLKEAENDQKKNEILKRYKIDMSSWDEAFKEAFQIMINTPPIKSLAERMVNYIETDYGEFDELIKNCDKCKKNVKKDTNTYCNKVLDVNLETSMSRIINEFVPGFLQQMWSGVENIPGDIKKAEENHAIKQILNKSSGYMPKSQKKKLIKSVRQIYKERNKDITIFGFNEEYKKLSILSKQFNLEDKKYAFTQGTIHFQKMGFGEKANAALSNKAVKHAILGLSLANLTYSVMHLTKTFMEHKALSEQFKFRLNEIRQRFTRHQSEVKVITEETDIDQAIQLTVECGRKFQQDLDDAEELVSEITDAMNGVKTEKNKTIINMIASAGGTLLGLFGSAVTKGDDRIEYGSTSLANVLSFAINAADIKKQNEILKEYKKTLEDVIKLKNEILDEIDKLRKKFQELKSGHFS